MDTPRTQHGASSPIREDYQICETSWTRLLHGVRLYYRRCPDCGQTWAGQLSDVPVIRIGRELFRCKCGSDWATGRVEWAHLSPKEKRSYFSSTAEIGVAICSLFVPAVFGYFIAEVHWRGVLTGAMWGAVGGGAFVGLLWSIKSTIVALSLRRCPPPISVTKGLFPWEW